MVIHVHTVAWNEVDLMPWFLSYYGAFADRVFVHDAGSDDGTHDVVAACPVAELVDNPVGRAVGLDDAHHVTIKDNAWRGRGADWVFCVDADELVVSLDCGMRDALARFESVGQHVPVPEGWDMVGGLPPFVPGALLHNLEPTGFRAAQYDKCALFRAPAVAAMNYSPGCHDCAPVGPDGVAIPRWPAEPRLVLLNYRWMGGKERVVRRRVRTLARFSPTNRAHGWGLNDALTAERTAECYDEAVARAVEVPGLRPAEPAFTAPWGGDRGAVWTELVVPHLGRPNARAVEVGVWEGATTRWLLERLTAPGATLTAIDTFAGSEDLASHGQPAGNVYERFRRNTFAFRDRLEVRRGTSSEALLAMRQGGHPPADFIYLDAGHRADSVLEDAVLAWPLLGKGGILAFDDYGWAVFAEPHRRPGPAIDAFLTCYGGRLDVLHRGYQVFVRKRW